MNQDINAITNDSNSKINNLMRQGKTAFFGSIIEGVSNAGMAYFMGGGNSKMLSSAGQKISNSQIGTSFQNWYNGLRGWNKGGFGQLPSANGYINSNINKIT